MGFPEYKQMPSPLRNRMPLTTVGIHEILFTSCMLFDSEIYGRINQGGMLSSLLVPSCQVAMTYSSELKQ